MEMNQAEFARLLEQLKETARLQGNMLMSEQIEEAFEDYGLGEDKMALIHEYLQKNRISIDEPGETDQNLSGEDRSYLELYLEELKDIKTASDGEKRAVMMSALVKDETACARLVEIFLEQVVEIAKLYAGQGALVEDLIGEGNVALAMAVNMLDDCVESIEEIDGFIVKMIMDAMEDYIGEDSDSRQADEKVLERVNQVYEKSKELGEELLRKVTVAELAAEMGISEDQVREAVRFSANNMDYIEDEADAEL